MYDGFFDMRQSVLDGAGKAVLRDSPSALCGVDSRFGCFGCSGFFQSRYFNENAVALLRNEISKKYFAPKIKKILYWKERFGTAYVECETDVGKLSFSVKDVIRSIIRLSDDRLFFVDVDGCRYEIESIKALDKKSYSKIELYI